MLRVDSALPLMLTRRGANGMLACRRYANPKIRMLNIGHNLASAFGYAKVEMMVFPALRSAIVEAIPAARSTKGKNFNA